MIVLGISETHCATAAILRDGAIVGCASEERFTRLKNDAGYPRLAIDALLRELGLRAEQIALVGVAGRGRKLGGGLGVIDPARGKFTLSEGERLELVTGHLGLGAERILTLDHHT